MNPVYDLFKEPGEGNLGWGFIETLFGSVPMGQAIGVVLGALVFLGSLLLAYMNIIGMAQSAYTGKVLGEKWHSMFGPLRVVLGFGLLMPLGVAASGELPSTIAYFYRDVILRASVNLADETQLRFGTSILKDAKPLGTSSVGGLQLAQLVVEREVCAAVVNAKRDTFGTSPNELPPLGGTDATSGLIWTEVSGRTWDYGECGSFSFSTSEGRAAFDTARLQATGALVGEVRATIASAVGPITRYGVGGATRGDGKTIFYDADTARAILAKAYGNPRAAEMLSGWMLEKASAWDKAVVAAASAESLKVGQEERAKILRAMETQGFLASGTVYRSLSQVSGLTVGLAGEAPKAVAPDMPEWAREEYAAALGMFKAALRWDAAELSANDLAFAGDDDSGTISKLLGGLTRDMGEALTKGEFSVDPVGDMMTSGHRLLTGAQAAIAAGALAKIAGDNVVSKSLGAGGSLEWLMKWASYGIIIALIVGSLWAYILPMVPFIMVFMMAISWFVLILEGLVAIHLWAFSLVSMEGNDFIDSKQKPGVSILFNIMLRPALSMLVLCGSLEILPYALNVLNVLWGTGFYGAQGGHIIDPVGLLVGILMLAWLQWQLCIRTFGMIPTVADRVGAWFGSASTQGYSEGSNTDALAVGMAALAARPAQGAMPSTSRIAEQVKPDAKGKASGDGSEGDDKAKGGEAKKEKGGK